MIGPSVAEAAVTDTVEPLDTAVDAAVDAAVPDVVTVANTTNEALGAVYVLCDPPRDAAAVGVRDGSCGTGVLATLDPDDDRALARYRCNGADGGTGSPVIVGGLANGSSLEVAVVLEDRAGNRSPAVRAGACVTPRSTTDFWEHYRARGGNGAIGFCAARPGNTPPAGSGAGWCTLAALVVLGALRRRRLDSGRCSRSPFAPWTRPRP